MIGLPMPHLSRTIHCFAADDEGHLAGATVTDTPLGASARLIEAIPGALDMPAPQLGAKLPKVRKGDAVVFVCPSALASARPFAVTTKAWPGAKEDVIASVATLFPLTSDDARVGTLDLAPDDDTGADRACLVGVSSTALRPWTEHLRAAIGRTPDAMLTPAQCLPALGFHNDETVRVLEPVGPGENVEHLVHRGQPVEIARTPDTRATTPAYRLPGGASTDTSTSISLADLALAGALTPTVSRRCAAPVQGAMPAPRSRWILPAAACLIACVLVWFALSASEKRTEALRNDLEISQNAIEPDAQRVADIRRQALTLHALLEGAIAPTIDTWTPALPDLQAAHDALPDGVWLYDIELTADRLELSGVASDPGAVLRAIETSPAFRAAAFTLPPAPVPDRDGESFYIYATRTNQVGGTR